MGRRKAYTREFKLEAVKLIRDRGVSFAQASRDLSVHPNVLRKWVADYEADPGQAFPGQGQMKPEQLEIERLRREAPRGLAGELDVRRARCVAERLLRLADTSAERTRQERRRSRG